MNTDSALNSKEGNIITKVIAFLISAFLIWFVIMLILTGIVELTNLRLPIFIPLAVSVIISAYISYKLVQNIKYLNSCKKIIPYLGELVLPTILSSLFVLFVDTKDVGYDEEVLNFTFCSLLFFIVLVEWFRRSKYKNDNPYLIRYLYVPILVIAFVLGIWYVNMMAE